jgi:hypothetical protein
MPAGGKVAASALFSAPGIFLPGVFISASCCWHEPRAKVSIRNILVQFNHYIFIFSIYERFAHPDFQPTRFSMKPVDCQSGDGPAI